MSFLLRWIVDGGDTTGAFFKRMPQIEFGGDARIMEEERCDSEARTRRTISIHKRKQKKECTSIFIQQEKKRNNDRNKKLIIRFDFENSLTIIRNLL